MEAVAVAALILAALALALAVLAVRRSGAVERPGDPESVPADVPGLRSEVAALKAESEQALRHLAVVRYDAFGDMGGHLSWTVALLDDAGDGLVLTSIHGRQESRSYAKAVAGWTGDQQLSPEETQAVDRARG